MSYAVTLPDHGTLDSWRRASRIAISHQIAPEAIDWTGQGGLFAAADLPQEIGPHRAHVPASFLDLAKSAIWHKSPDRAALLYQALWRLDQRDGDPLSAADPLGRRLQMLAKNVRRDIHKMHAFVRFREMPSDTARRCFAAWFEPEHHTLEPGTPFFAKRFGDMDWMIATPELTAHFENGKLRFGPAGARPDLPDDASESLWATYFTNIFNPARIKLDAMRSEMPKKYWKNLPETALIPAMLKDAEARVQRMREAGSTPARPGAAAISTRYRAAMPQAPELPGSLDAAREAALHCRRCGLCEKATQTVWGMGAPDAAVMIVGEQPGDQEDLEGRPFVGPAGQVLHQAMGAAGVDPGQAWLTNAVKHFKFAPRGKKRIHQSPDRSEIEHCRWWLGLELGFVQPKLTVALGASAAYALTGNAGLMQDRQGKVEQGLHGGPVLVTWHPSYILRLADPAAACADLLAALSKAQASAN
ncbi:UdgX family uracil-DNA binding protein [Yoonia sp.]|uniref:UdgX family uracil-DNA binding protein n=1 Tax=Yoonia sp. TaxID=2212373 RepID=UPI00391B4E43